MVQYPWIWFQTFWPLLPVTCRGKKLLIRAVRYLVGIFRCVPILLDLLSGLLLDRFLAFSSLAYFLVVRFLWIVSLPIKPCFLPRISFYISVLVYFITNIYLVFWWFWIFYSVSLFFSHKWPWKQFWNVPFIVDIPWKLYWTHTLQGSWFIGFNQFLYPHVGLC